MEPKRTVTAVSDLSVQNDFIETHLQYQVNSVIYRLQRFYIIYLLSSTVDLPEVSISGGDRTFRVGEQINLRCNLISGDRVYWEFGSVLVATCFLLQLQNKSF